MDAVQLFGGNGYLAGYRAEQLACDVKSSMIYAGSNEVRITHIAKGLLAQRWRPWSRRDVGSRVGVASLHLTTTLRCHHAHDDPHR